MAHKIVALPGDGVGPEVTACAHAVLDRAARAFGFQYEYEEALIGGDAVDHAQDPLPADVEALCAASDGVLLGAVGGPKWDMAPPALRPERGLLRLRSVLGVFANLRPVRIAPIDIPTSPFRPGHLAGVDVLFVRELTGGIYFGEKTEGDQAASDLCTYERREVERVARVAGRLAGDRRRRVTHVDKQNVLATSRLWRRTTEQIFRDEFPDVDLRHMLVDAMAMALITKPAEFDVVLTENMFGDILTDEAAALAGSIGLLPSASIGDDGPGLFEPIHGSAPDIAGRGAANPVGMIRCVAMLLGSSLGESEAAAAIERAVDDALKAGVATHDLGGSAGSEEMTRAIVERIDP
ncbi:MAG: 3-isopropylmalate dehydrogenase [Pseudomonadota bacterium]